MTGVLIRSVPDHPSAGFGCVVEDDFSCGFVVAVSEHHVSEISGRGKRDQNTASGIDLRRIVRKGECAVRGRIGFLRSGQFSVEFVAGGFDEKTKAVLEIGKLHRQSSPGNGICVLRFLHIVQRAVVISRGAVLVAAPLLSGAEPVREGIPSRGVQLVLFRQGIGAFRGFGLADESGSIAGRGDEGVQQGIGFISRFKLDLTLDQV